MKFSSGIPMFVALIMCPLLPGIISRVKAKIAGRCGQPLLQIYFDIYKLLRKGAVISQATSWVFVAGPSVALASSIIAASLMPLGHLPALMNFPGDFILIAVLFGLARFSTMLAALDTGSSFEGMGASREAWFSIFAEIAFLLTLSSLAYETGFFSLTGMTLAITADAWISHGIIFTLLITSAFIVLLAENSRIPVDDPTTHLELTMVHEVMVLDHSGPDFAFITYGQSLKLWCFCSIVAGMFPLGTSSLWVSVVLRIIEIFFVAILVGFVESFMARLKLLCVPQLLTGAIALAIFALALSL